ncbi:MAG: hypothetical protein LBC30_02620 [Puniceicoccales bacterium]|jgi:opacity protein-like surface antigen|nr:hypothetical protein [Puniceicoccales bacterium]
MKKVFLIIAIMCGMDGLYAGNGPTLPKQDFAIDTSVGFKSEYFFRGRHDPHKVFAKTKIEHQLFNEVTAYVGVNSVLGITPEKDDPSSTDNISPCVGILFNVFDKVTLDAGYEYHLYTAIPLIAPDGKPLGMRRHSQEVHLGIILDTFMKLSLDSFYDFERREVAVEGMGVYSFKLPFLFSGLSIDIWAKVGYDYTSNPLGITRVDIRIPKGCYYYYAAGADLAYRFNHARVKVGVSYEGNFAKEDFWINKYATTDGNIVISASVNCLF